MTKFSVNGVEYIGVEMKREFMIQDGYLYMLVAKRTNGNTTREQVLKLPDKYEIIGRVKDLTDRQASELLGMPLDRYDNPMFDHDEIQGEIKIAQLQYNLTPDTLIIKIIK